MRCADLTAGQISSLQLVISAGRRAAAIRPGAEAVLTHGADVFVLTVDGGDVSVDGVSPDDVALLERLATRRLPAVSWVLAATPAPAPQRLTLQVHEFPMALRWDTPMELAVDTKIVDDVSRRRGRPLPVEEVCEWLKGQVVLDGACRVLLTAGTRPAPGVTAFRLHGRAIAIDVATGPDNRLWVTRVVEAAAPKPGDERRPVVLAHVDLRFENKTAASVFRGVARATLDQLMAQGDNYLALWREYNGMERESVLRRARQFGAWQFTTRRTAGAGWRFEMKDADGLRRVLPEQGTELEVSEDVPGWLGDSAELAAPPGPRKVVGAFLELRGVQLTLGVPDDDDRQPPKSGWVHVSLQGDLARLRARDEAWSQVASMENPMPQLAFLLLGQDVPTGRRGTVEPMSQAARACFKGEPTPKQIEAMDVALNTPDIAIIQGPPGTGKTQVIAAIKVRLAELAEERQGIGGLFLVSAFQHEAVENAASRIRVLGLPAAKIGHRKRQTEVHDGFEEWRAEHAGEVRAQLAGLPSGPGLVALQAARRRISGWLASPSKRDSAASVARWVYEQLGRWLPPELRDRALSLSLGAKPTAPPEDTTREFALKAVRQLRTEPIGWSDDGPRMAWLARARLREMDQLTSEESTLLASAAAESGEPSAEMFGQLEGLQNALVDRLLPKPSEAGPARGDADAEGFLRDVNAAVADRVAQTADGVALALEELHHAFEHDSEGIREAVSHYTTVLAATCGQSIGADMRDRKGEGIRFDTVVLDEAGRANPLDAMIPMSRAERRIVMVGDHRQLSHLLEPDVEGALEGTVSDASQKALRKSLFERLFLSLRSGRDPVRVVTLDKQFRMHPVLGGFVSQMFYEPYKEGFGSPTPASEFQHDLARWPGSVVGWANVPLADGAEQSGKSKSRPAEAERVAAEVAAILSDPAAIGLTVGVVSFYSAQVDEILRALVGAGLAARGDDGTPEINTEYRKRLRVGTVDAFQGREFDVVLLSCTRSSRPRPASAQADPERELRTRYGHLLIENRLCVAMSRAERLMIVVGDLAMFAGGPVPALAQFAQLCRGEHGLVR